MPVASGPQAGNGRVVPDTTVTRVMLRPIGSPMPLGAFTLVPAGLMLAGLQLGWFSQHDAKAIPLIILGFAVPLQFTSSVFAFLARDSLVGTGFGLFTGVWLAFGLTGLSAGLTATNPVLGVFFLGCGGLLAMLMSGGLAGGKAAAGAVILAGSARFILSGLYELTSQPGVERAAGIVGLVFVGVAAYVGLAALLEDNAKKSILPLGRRGRARAAIDDGLDAQFNDLETEAGVREQL